MRSASLLACRLALICAVTALSTLLPSAHSTAIAAPPGDVVTISTIVELANKKKGAKNLRSEMLNLAYVSVERVAARSGLEDEALTDDFDKWFEDRVKPNIKMVASSKRRNTQEGRAALWAQVRRLSSDNFAHEIISEWLRLPAYTEPLLRLGKNGKPRGRALTGQVTARYSGQGLKLVPGASRVMVDTGGAGSHNGILDFGEWAKVRWVVSNTTGRPYVSSSAWMSTESSCAWVDPVREYLLAEMTVDGKNAAFTTWVYFSNECSSNQTVALVATIKDTHRNISGERLRLDLKVKQRATSRLTDGMLDSDVPGWSDGKPLPEITPKRRFEYSTGVYIPDPQAHGVKMNYVFGKQVSGLFEKSSYTKGPLLKLGGGRFGFNDDLDIRTHKRKVMEAAVKSLQNNRDERWFVNDEGVPNRLWLAVDTTSRFQVPAGDPHKTSVAPPSEDAALPSLSSAPTMSELRLLVETYLTLVPRPAVPKHNDSLAATDGYEVVINWQEIRKQLEGDAGDRPAKRDTKTPRTKKTGKTNLLTYRNRHYLWLPVMKIAAPVCDVDEDGYAASNADPECEQPRYDCDDDDPSIYPDAEDICGDGIDQDCNGVDLNCLVCDEDGDGQSAEFADLRCLNRNDCNDSDPEVYEGAREVCGDGVDNNCNGRIDEGCNKSSFRLDIGVGGGVASTAETGRTIWWEGAPAKAQFWLDVRASIGPNHSFVIDLGLSPAISTAIRGSSSLLADPVKVGTATILFGYGYQARVNRRLELAPRVLVGLGLRTYHDLSADGFEFDRGSTTWAAPYLVIEPGFTVRPMFSKNAGLHFDFGMPLFVAGGAEPLPVIFGIFAFKVTAGLSLRF